MKIQTKLYLTNTVAFSIVFFFMMSLILFVFYNNSKTSIYNILKNTSYISALFYLEEDELNDADFQQIKIKFESEVFNKFYQFYNIQDSIEFGATSSKIPIEILEQVRREKELAFDFGEFFCYAIFYEDNQGDFVVVAKEKKKVIYGQLYNLTITMLVVWLLGLLMMVFINRRIAKQAYKPFRRVINEVNSMKLDSSQLEIELTHTNDELELLIKTFNKLLSQLVETLNMQRNFVKYVSHEFKTPLTAMMGNLEVFQLKDRTVQEYNKLASTLIEEIQYLEETLNTLIFLSDVKHFKDNFAESRIDDLVWIAVEKLKIKYKNSVKIHLDLPPNIVDLLSVKINFNQVLLAIYNIMDNGIKYSESKRIDILFGQRNNHLLLIIKDYGIGIHESEIKNITKPFYRSSATQNISGNGIGLTLATKLLKQNHIAMDIQSELNVGTSVYLEFTS